MRRAVIAICILLGFSQAAVAAQSSEALSCGSSPAQLENNKRLVLEFFAFRGSPEEQARRFLADNYIQHNPRLLRMDEITGATGRAAWLLGFHEALRRGIHLDHVSGAQLDKPAALMAECDLVTVLFATRLEDPDRPGSHYDAFVFETFRVRNGKFAEHWDAERLETGWMTKSGTDAVTR